MEYEWDETKRQANLEKHGADFLLVKTFDWETAIDVIDDRKDYGESRRVAIGRIDFRLYVLVYTRRLHVCRIISLRKANIRERDYYENEAKTRPH
ncbi:MAG: BrnT family toxin [Nitrospirae bacterium]|jgi:hypothetical protein|nr:BrnT family toxin [Nitrospirota bacterium]